MPCNVECEDMCLCEGVVEQSPSMSMMTTTQKKMQEKYSKAAEKAWSQSWDLLKDTTNWSKEFGQCSSTGHVHSKKIHKLGKVFRLEATLDATIEEVFAVLVTEVVDWPVWNPTILECKHIMKINNNTDVAYSVGAPQVGGLVSSRDFVNLRHWRSRDGILVAAACGVSHPDCPISKHHIRANNQPASYVFAPVQGRPDQCLFYCFLNTDLKGWLPQWMIDKAMSGVLMDYLKHLKIYLEKRREI